MALPALRMERDVGEHIDGSFEHIEAPICADVVEAVAGIAALHIEPEGFAEAVGAALVGAPVCTVVLPEPLPPPEDSLWI